MGQMSPPCPAAASGEVGSGSGCPACVSAVLGWKDKRLSTEQRGLRGDGFSPIPRSGGCLEASALAHCPLLLHAPLPFSNPGEAGGRTEGNSSSKLWPQSMVSVSLRVRPAQPSTPIALFVAGGAIQHCAGASKLAGLQEAGASLLQGHVHALAPGAAPASLMCSSDLRV